MDMLRGLQSLFGGEPSSARQNGGDTPERSDRELQKKNSSQREELVQLNAKIDEIRELVAQLEEQEEALVVASEKSEGEILDRIHTEDVACYRSMKSLVTELQENVNEVELSEDSLTQIRTSFKGLKFFSVFALLSFIALIVVLLVEFGVIRV